MEEGVLVLCQALVDSSAELLTQGEHCSDGLKAQTSARGESSDTPVATASTLPRKKPVYIRNDYKERGEFIDLFSHSCNLQCVTSCWCRRSIECFRQG
ncbi:hypothetical protein K440DRAFT_20796 [Wilcoxina mikolae CBS 423.85]|nr:hypothetical protein K440DRAFT_20796 [Wilcoxina mikolae CBS 423.85]